VEAREGRAESSAAPPMTDLHFLRSITVNTRQRLDVNTNTMPSTQRLSTPSSTQLIPEKPWHAYMTIDLLALVLARSIFHPYIAWLIPLCLRSLSYSYSHPHFKYACIYATCVTVFALICRLDKRLAWGPARKLNWDEEVVVITGGAGGLGKVLAETYGMRGVSVAVCWTFASRRSRAKRWRMCAFTGAMSRVLRMCARLGCG
jgi:hypothetical protein